jgi:arylsulfatase A-like enzyme
MELSMSRSIPLLAAAWFLMIASATALAAARPNVVVILTDDQGWGDLSVHGNTNLSTPNIDSLARDGALFERFFVCPVCSPTRAEFLTGRYHPRGGVYSTSTGGERLDLDERTIAQAFKASGYATGAFGKWHNGTQHPYHPNARGFDEYYGFTSGHWGDYFDPPLDHNGRLTQGKGFIIDDLTDRAMVFIEQNRDKPFFCYIPYNTPHTPAQVPDRFYDKFRDAEIKLRADAPRPGDAVAKKANKAGKGGKVGAGGGENLDFTRAVLAMVENIDWNVGRLLAKLRDLNLADDTIVVFFCDNGPNSARWNGGMKGRKGSTDEGGVRSPLLVRWPGRIPAGSRVTPIAGAIDLLPTLTDLAGVPIPTGHPLDGVSLKGLLTGATRPMDWPDRMIFTHWAGKVSVRTQQHRLDADGQLFDMVADPRQTSPINAAQPQVAAKLAQAVAQWSAQTLPGLGRDDRPYPIGGGGFEVTQLPARDGEAHGNVQRSAKAPNCSFFQNWTSPDDAITWNAEVLTPGKYEAIVHYTCPPADVGSVVELSFMGASVRATVSPAHDPPLTGKEHDRADRGSESYIKDFKPLRLGVIDLPAGRGPLTLKALKVAGKTVMDVRMIVLNRLP